LKSRVVIATTAVRAGMFVVELDRPWSETPFLVQGFLVNDTEDIRLLRSLCLEVAIDPRRSAADSLRELIDLYDMPVEVPARRADQQMEVRMRYVEHGRYQSQPLTTPWISLGKLRETVTRGFQSLQPTSRRQTRAIDIEQVDANEDDDDQPILPRFSRSQIRYASVDEQRGKPVSAARPVAWEKRSSRLNRQVQLDNDDSLLSRLEAFDRIIESLRPDLSGLTEKLGALQRFARSRRFIGWRSTKRVPLTAAESEALQIPSFIDLVVYKDRVGIESEIANARRAVTLTEDTLAKLKADASNEAAFRVDGLPDVVDAIVESVSRNADAMIWLARVRGADATAYSHSIKVTSYLLALGRHLGFPKNELAQLTLIGLLMDIGKLDLDPAIVNKRDALTDEEFEMLQSHVELGLTRLAATMHLDRAVLEGIAHHHEWIDGSGYPQGLKGDQISIFGRMSAIADMYAALTTDRPYAPTMSSYDALQLMYARADKQLHGPLVEQFVRAIGLYPVGSLVLLSTEEVAVVTALDKVQRLEPRVLVLTGPDKNTLARPYELDLLKQNLEKQEDRIRILRSLPAGVHNIDFRNFYIA
jgi:HD-GYP domain-containing protein (c-di-GMP phosphodiesterase class II)